MNDAARTSIDTFRMTLDGTGPLMTLLLAVVALAASWYFYRDTVPPVTGWTRRTLIGLRACALLLLVLALAQPVLHLGQTESRTAAVAVLVDTSSSMDRASDPGRRDETLSVLRTLRESLGDGGVFFGFDSELHPLGGDAPVFDGRATDIATALDNIADRRDIASVVLVSDGRWNIGRNPAGVSLPGDLPVHAVALGRDTGTADISIRSVSAAPVGYDGTRHDVTVMLAATGMVSAPVTVEIREQDLPLTTSRATVTADGLTEVALDVPLSGPGFHAYTVRVTTDRDEPGDNNARSFGVQVMKSRFRALVIADAPSPDLAFLRRVIDGDDAWDAVYVVSRGLGGMNADTFPSELDGFDVIVLLNGGGQVMTADNARAIGQLADGGAGLWLIGSTPPPQAAAPLAQMLPLDWNGDGRNIRGGFTFRLIGAGQRHFITTGMRTDGITQSWSELPPLISIVPVSPSPGRMQVLVEAVIPDTGGAGIPALMTGRIGTGKLVAMPVSGAWRWKLMLEGAGRDGGFHEAFILGVLRWMTTGADTSPLAVTTDATTYLGGQDVTFEARLYDAIFSPVPGAKITVVVDGDRGRQVILDETAPAVYRGTLRTAEPGIHTWEATAVLDGAEQASATGEYRVDDVSLEQLDTTPDHGALADIAGEGKGISVTPAGIDSVLTRAVPGSFTERTDEDRRLAASPLLPVLALGLIIVEWALRKKRGML